MESSLGKCQMRVEMITFIFSIFTVMTSLVAILVGIITITANLVTEMPFISLMLLPEPYSYSYRHKGVKSNMDPRPTALDWKSIVKFTDTIGPPVVLVLGVIGFIFSVLLLVGVQKKKSGFVKAYFIYGVITVPVSCLLFIILTFSDEDFIQYIFSHIGILFVLVIYIVMLVFVRETYRKFESGVSKQFSHKRLTERYQIYI